ncbi:hypothetical protein J2S00_004035 [Caldalkalibacillus uzonensis]|uniref:Uncharacterized protein n=1 Tax=Caldalkalibacillus uzonensis TaxID=353224 RepID=A0ABU0CYG0_9BACI|nr:hypothetical protein [Caldalkalibacillus uzonensis]MDQ0341191.1 hypothetical protein [Caldalkalibacillus uzonensis]
MARFTVADFYYGAVLSMLFNNKIVPVLFERNESRQIYNLSTNNGDFRMFIKYRSYPTVNQDDYRSWHFVFSDKDIEELFKYLDDEYKLLLALVCGSKEFKNSELAVLHPEEIKEYFSTGRTTLTISRKKNEKQFRISIGGGRNNSIKILTNRLI